MTMMDVVRIDTFGSRDVMKFRKFPIPFAWAERNPAEGESGDPVTSTTRGACDGEMPGAKASAYAVAGERDMRIALGARLR